MDIHSASPGFTISIRVKRSEKQIVVEDEDEEVVSKKRKVGEREKSDAGEGSEEAVANGELPFFSSSSLLFITLKNRIRTT